MLRSFVELFARVLNSKCEGKTMIHVARIGAAFLVAGLVMFHEVRAEAPVRANDPALAEVTGLLDSWSGQRDVLRQAKQKLDRILQQDPANFRALKELARYEIMAGYQNGRYVQGLRKIYTVGNYAPGTLDRSETAVREALRINPRYAEGFVYLGYIYIERDKLEGAATALAEAERIGTDDPWLQLNWAQVLSNKGEDAAASQRWRRVIESDTGNRKARLAAYGFMTQYEIEAGNFDKARALYEDQIKLSPGNAWLRSNYADFLRGSLGLYDEAIEQAGQALQVMDFGNGRMVLAYALYSKWADMIAKHTGSEQEAERYFQQALSLYPDLDSLMADLGAKSNTESVVRALVAKKKVSIDARMDDRSTALLIATNANRPKVVKFLLEMGANPNIEGGNGWTPLLSAADENHEEIVKMLLAKKANNLQTMNGRDAAMIAERHGNAELARLIRTSTKSKT